MISYGLNIGANNTGSSRTGVITIKQPESDKTVTITVTQAAVPNEFSANGSSVSNLPASAQSVSVPVTSVVNGVSNSPYTVTSSDAWCSASRVSSDGSLNVRTSANSGANSRNCTLTLTQTETGAVITITVLQRSPYEFSISPSVAPIAADGTGSVVATITSTKNGSAQGFTQTSISSWLSATISGNTITITAQQNTELTSRSGSVVFTQTDSGKTCAITINQSAADQFTINDGQPLNISADALNTAINVVSIVNSEPLSPWTVEDHPNWITATASVSISKLALQILVNGSASPRTGTVVCEQTATGQTATLTVNQAASDD